MKFKMNNLPGSMNVIKKQPAVNLPCSCQYLAIRLPVYRRAAVLAIFCLLFFFLNSAAQIQAEPRPKAMLLANLSSGQILYALNADMRIPPASLTKIMTMFLTMDAIKAKKLSLNQKITIPKIAAQTGGSAMRLTAGEKVPVVRLLAGMAVASGNDAATALAMRLGGKNFPGMMNAKARQLDMKNSKFKNGTGLPAAGHYSTARDLLLLCRAYLRAYPQAARFHKMTFFMHKGAIARNTNSLLGRVEGVDGLKTGWTVASGYNLITTARRGKTRLIAIVLGCQNKEIRDSATIALLNAGFKYPANPAKIKKIINGR